MNANPYKGRLSKKRRGKSGNLDAVIKVLWEGIMTAEEILHDADEHELQLRAVHALSQAAGQYARLLEVGELEARLDALERGHAA